MKCRKHFFFEKKKQKTFPLTPFHARVQPPHLRAVPNAREGKVFWSFFSKKDYLPLLTLAFVLPAHAAAPPTIEQITVTAKRRAQNLEKVPQTVDVIRAKDLTQLNLVAFQDIQQIVSGLQLSDNGGRGQNISLRGITYDPDTTANPAVDTYVNEVPLSQTSSAFQDQYDLDSIDVIRGPQGTLRGRTSPAGAIIIDTKRPAMDGWDGFITQSFSNNGLFQTQAAIGDALIPNKLAVRVAGLFDQNDLYGTRSLATGQQDFNLQHSGRITIVAKPTESLNIVLMHQEGNDRTRELFGVSGNGAFGPITPAQNLSVLDGPYIFYNRTNLTTLQATQTFDASELNYTAGYQAVRDEFQEYSDKGGLLKNYDTGSQMLGQSVGALSQELRFQSTGDPRFSYMGGLYYLHQDASATVFTPSEILFNAQPGTPYPSATPIANIDATVAIPQLVTDYAIFTDESFKITPNDIVEGGLRWQFEKQYRSSGYTVTLPFGLGTQSQQLVAPNNQHEEYRAWTGLASYTHYFAQNVSLYANYGQSFRPGGIVLGISLPLPENFLIFKPETSADFEVGTKARLLNGRLRLTADIFHQTYVNYIARENNIYTTLGYQSITTNGNAIAQGFEASAATFLTDAWRLDANTTYSDARYDHAQLPCNDFAGTGAPNTDGLPHVTGTGITSLCTTNGTLGAPNWYFTVNSQYDWPLTGAITAFVRGLYSFTPANRLTLQAVGQDPRNITNVYVGARAPGGAWEAFLFVKNAFGITGSTNLYGEQFDSGYTLSGQSVNYDTKYASSLIVRPREIGVSLTYRF
jgi:iron complex outermembrane receptor protein